MKGDLAWYREWLLVKERNVDLSIPLTVIQVTDSEWICDEGVDVYKWTDVEINLGKARKTVHTPRDIFAIVEHSIEVDTLRPDRPELLQHSVLWIGEQQYACWYIGYEILDDSRVELHFTEDPAYLE